MSRMFQLLFVTLESVNTCKVVQKDFIFFFFSFSGANKSYNNDVHDNNMYPTYVKLISRLVLYECQVVYLRFGEFDKTTT